MNNQESHNSEAAADVSARAQYITKAELSQLTGLSPATIHRYKDAGLLPYVQPRGKGGRVLYPLAAIERMPYMAAAQAGCTPAETRPHVLAGPRPRWQEPISRSR